MSTITRVHVLYGGAGFIGTNLAISLVNNSEHVVVVDLKTAPNWAVLEKIPEVKIIKITKEQNFLSNINKELMNLNEKIGEEYEVVFWHLAANSDIRASSQDPKVDLDCTLRPTIHALEVFSKLTYPKVFVFASSSAVYGYQPGIKLHENSLLNPISSYGVMKMASEFLIRNEGNTNFRYFIFRFPNVVGPFLTHGIIYDLFQQLKNSSKVFFVLGDGTQTKQYMHVNELIDGMLRLIHHSQESILNLGPISGSTSVQKIVDLFQSVNNLSWKVEYGTTPFGWNGDVPRFEFSTRRARRHKIRLFLNSSDSVKLAIEQNKVLLVD
jgi:UDP-glucose 4-epimerase